jgi:hypothetical protein
LNIILGIVVQGMDALLELIVVLVMFALLIALISRSLRAIVLVGVCLFVVSMLALAGVIA